MLRLPQALRYLPARLPFPRRAAPIRARKPPSTTGFSPPRFLHSPASPWRRVPVSMADKIAQCPASANTPSPARYPRVTPRDRSIAGECEHHQRAAGTFNGSTRPPSRSNALNSLPLFSLVPPTLSSCILSSLSRIAHPSSFLPIPNSALLYTFIIRHSSSDFTESFFLTSSLLISSAFFHLVFRSDSLERTAR